MTPDPLQLSPDIPQGGPGGGARPPGPAKRRYLTALRAVLHRELARFLGQKSRLVAALVRPLVWLLVFAAGFRAALGLSITPPYQTYITYETYILPGLLGMICLFNGMQSSLSLVYDREMGSMRLLLTAPLPRGWLLFAKLLAGTLISLLQCLVFLGIGYAWGIRPPLMGLIAVIPALLLTGLMLGALGLLLSSLIRQLENFAGVMNFVIFPMFFLSSALYPLWKMAEASPALARACALNPFTQAVELIRFSLYLTPNWPALGWTCLATLIFAAAALYGYDPARGFTKAKG